MVDRKMICQNLSHQKEDFWILDQVEGSAIIMYNEYTCVV